ncbi:MAG: DUF167 domain-containing protein [Alphaproteobacteria bacterium]|nr:DUF167 domain-containing protein [Alphaproteobacteria bacterium]
MLPDAVLNPARNGARVTIHLRPRGQVDRVIGVAAAAGDGRVIKVSVKEPAEDGRANAALLQLLARTWQLPRSDLAIVAGAISRRKIVHISGDPRRLLEHLASLIAALPGP